MPLRISRTDLLHYGTVHGCNLAAKLALVTLDSDCLTRVGCEPQSRQQSAPAMREKGLSSWHARCAPKGSTLGEDHDNS